MDAETKKQIYDLIKNSVSPLLLSPGLSNLDAASGALSLFLMFKKMNKSPQIVSAAPLSDKFLFLPEARSISSDIINEAIYKVAVNVSKSDLQQVSYDQENDLLNIYLTLKKGKIKIDSVTLDGAKFKYDLIIALGIPNLNSLGKIYSDNRDLFFHTPIINIDHHAANDRFGTINAVEAESAQMTYAVAGIIKDLLPSGMDNKMATLLLASVISATDNFQASKIHAGLFALAAALIDSGAEREEIIKHIYGLKADDRQGAVIVERATGVAENILKKKPDIQSGRIRG